MRDCTPVGAVRGSLYLPSGYVLPDGATVDRADYPRLVRLADTHNLWTNDTVANAGLFGVGDGSTTMVLPNWIDRMEQMASTAGASVAAGLPNITGYFYTDNGYLFSPNFYSPPDYSQGAFRAEGPTANVRNGTISSDVGHYPYLSFNASRSSAIYGNSTTVQPPAIKLLPILRY